MNTNPYEVVLEHWQKRSVSLLPPAGPEQVRSVFEQLGAQVSTDVVRLYATTGGFSPDDKWNDVWSLWPLNRILAENQTHSSGLIWFADFLICSHIYAFKYEDAETSSVHITDWDSPDSQSLLVADSVAEFLHLYVSDPDAILVDHFDLERNE